MESEIKIKDKAVNLIKEKLPNHIAFIMDGNGRWAKKRYLPRLAGHRSGVIAIKKIVKAIVKLEKIKFITLYAFSTENWNRPKDEVSGLMKLLVEFLKKEVRELKQEGVRIRHIGNIDRLPEFARNELLNAEKYTEDEDKLNMVLALNYSGRDEILRTVNKLISDKELKKVDETDFSNMLDTGFMPDPDLIIRTSGEERISNFLLWQSAYSEFFFTPVFWPDFNPEELFRILLEFQKRERRYGGI